MTDRAAFSAAKVYGQLAALWAFCLGMGCWAADDASPVGAALYFLAGSGFAALAAFHFCKRYIQDACGQRDEASRQFWQAMKLVKQNRRVARRWRRIARRLGRRLERGYE